MDNADDPEANMNAGMSVGFVSGELRKSLPMLARASEADVKRVAEMEIANPKTPSEMKQVADIWYKVAGMRDFRDYEIKIFERSLYWYEKSVAKLKGVDAARKRVEELEKKVPLDHTKLNLKLTEKQWMRIKAPVFEVDARKIEKTKLALGPAKKPVSSHIQPTPGKWAPTAVASPLAGKARRATTAQHALPTA